PPHRSDPSDPRPLAGTAGSLRGSVSPPGGGPGSATADSARASAGGAEAVAPPRPAGPAVRPRRNRRADRTISQARGTITTSHGRSAPSSSSATRPVSARADQPAAR